MTAIELKDFTVIHHNEQTYAVDLGLPSGTLWCSVNVGASSPTDFGEYCQIFHGRDIASEKMGETYYTPTLNDFDELISHTRHYSTTVDGVDGMVFEAPNGNAIFLPYGASLCTSKYDDEIWVVNNEGSGAYWTKTPSESSTTGNYFDFVEISDKNETNENQPLYSDRNILSNKMPIRPIYSLVPRKEVHYKAVDMGLPSGTWWCATNLGANSPSKLGEFYELSENEDIVTKIRGAGYYTPTKEQYEELMAHTQQRRTVVDEEEGVLFVASNGNSIFLPMWESVFNTSGAYWTKTLHSADNYYYWGLLFSTNLSLFFDIQNKESQLTIRPVYQP